MKLSYNQSQSLNKLRHAKSEFYVSFNVKLPDTHAQPLTGPSDLQLSTQGFFWATIHAFYVSKAEVQARLSKCVSVKIPEFDTYGDSYGRGPPLLKLFHIT